MEKILLGKSDLKVSRIGLGTLAFGHKSKGIQDREVIFEVMNYALDNGINFIDTAEEYARGLTEEYIGEVLKNRGDREDIVICNKVGPTHLSYKNTLKATDHMLKRLQTDYIDLLLVHWPWPYTPMSETMKAMDELLEEGKIRYVGVSNCKNVFTQEAIDSLQNGEIIVNQIEYHLLNRIVEKMMLPFLREKGIVTMTYSPLYSGFLSTNYDENTVFPENDFRNYDPLFKNKENFVKSRELFQLMREIASKYDATSAEVAINWCLKDNDIIPIPGAKKISHVKSNIHATQWKLTNDEYDQLTKTADTLDLNWY